MHGWKGDEDYNWCITEVIKKDVTFFLIWSKLRKRVICVVNKPTDENLDEEVMRRVRTMEGCRIIGKRVILWSKDKDYNLVISKAKKGRHRKQIGIFNDYTYCIKDEGITLIKR